MARPFIPDPDDVTTDYPSFDPWPLLDRATDHDPVPETFIWPGAENDYTIRLDYAILEQLTLTVMNTTDDVELLPVRWRDNPGPGEVAVNFDRGLLKVHSSLATKAGSAGYTPLGSVIDAQWQSAIQKELAATQSALAGALVERHVLAVPGVPGTGTIGWVLIPANGMASRTVKRVIASAADVSYISDDTVIAAAGVNVYLPGSGTTDHATATGSGAVDTSGGDAWLAITCSNSGGHGNLSITIEVE